MSEPISHRGPDGQGVHVAHSVGLAHRRLSIIDLEGGQQPICNEDESVWVTFNGEIYNYVELQEELESLGHRFRTKCDTEVIVHAYEQWGTDCVLRFNGMFAFAVYDKTQRGLFLARDRLGIKPLVYLSEPSRFAFASEIQALERLEGFDSKVDLAAIDDFLQLAYIPAPATVYQNIRKLPPGHTLVIKQSGEMIGPNRYWDVDFDVEQETSQHQWLEALDDAIRTAIRLRLRSDVPFGAFLSGGVDSSLVVAYMSEILDEPVRTFNIGFEEKEYCEAEYARVAAKHCGTDHHAEIVRPDALAILPELIKHYGEPFGDSSAVPTYYVSKLARQHVKMVLSGDGGDEIFGGYRQYLIGAQRALPDRMTARKMMRRALGNAARLAGLMPRRKTSPLDVWHNLMAVFSCDERKRLWNKPPHHLCDPPRAIAASYDANRNWEYVSAMQYIDLKNYLPGDILTKVDIASMYHGLEARTPLLDHHVVELAARIPARFRCDLSDGEKPQGKVILKRLAERFYSRQFVEREKQGFSIPLEHWFQGDASGTMRDQLLDKHGRLSELFDEKELMAIVGPGKRNTVAYSTRLWLLLCLSEWFRQHPRARL